MSFLIKVRKLLCMREPLTKSSSLDGNFFGTPVI